LLLLLGMLLLVVWLRILHWKKKKKKHHPMPKVELKRYDSHKLPKRLPAFGVDGEFAIKGSFVPLAPFITEGLGKDILNTPCLG
jgi:hypothetical protein